MQNVKYTDSADFRCLENLKETSIDLYLVHAGWEQTAPHHIISMSRTEYIIHFVISGKGTYSMDGKTWELTAGSMFLISPDEPVTYCSDDSDPWFYAWVGFNGIRAEQILKACGFSRKNRVLPTPGDHILKSVENILNVKKLSAANDLRRNARLMEILATLIDFHTKLEKKDGGVHHDYSTSIYVEHAIDYIKCSYQQGINVTNICEYIGISRAYLNNSFQKELGMSVQKFLIDYRMHKAANLLMSTTKAVNEIAQAVGYEDPLAFSKAFKKKFEMSPKLYRMKKEKMDKFKEKQP